MVWKVKRLGVDFILLLLVSACSTFGSDNPGATLQAERTAIIAEGTAIADAMRIQGTQAAATAVAVDAYVQRLQGVNEGLAATLRAVIPPTQQIVENAGPVTPGLMSTRDSSGMALFGTSTPAPGGETTVLNEGVQLTEIATTARVRDSDGCADGTQTQFATTTSRIYLTTRARSIRAGTAMGVQWSYEGQVVFEDGGYTVPQDETDFCIWFFLEPTDVPFSVGSWSARWIVNGSPIEPAVSFQLQ